MKREKNQKHNQAKITSSVDIGWDAEQCLDFLETLSDLLRAYGKGYGEDVELSSITLNRLGFSIFEATVKVREELASLKGGEQ